MNTELFSVSLLVAVLDFSAVFPVVAVSVTLVVAISVAISIAPVVAIPVALVVTTIMSPLMVQHP